MIAIKDCLRVINSSLIACLFDSKYTYFMVLGPSCTVLGLIICEALTRQPKLKVFAKDGFKMHLVPAENPGGGVGVLASAALGLGDVLTKIRARDFGPKVFVKHVLKIRLVPAENRGGGSGVLTSATLGLGDVLTKIAGPVALRQSLEVEDMLSFVS